MLLVALLCQVFIDVTPQCPSPMDGKIVVEDKALDNLGLNRRQLIPAATEEVLLSTELISESTDPVLQAFWTMPVARVDETVITVADLMFNKQQQLVDLQKSASGNANAQRIQYAITVWLPKAIERAAVWNAIQHDFPHDEFNASWKQHEQAWEVSGRLSVKKSQNPKFLSDAVLEKHWKPMFIQHNVAQDYYTWKFITEQPADAMQPAAVSKLKSEWVAAFQRNAVQRAKVNTAHLISTKASKN